jgi:ABC-type glycerol-3-phosphate transport system substrate-binding protein
VFGSLRQKIIAIFALVLGLGAAGASTASTASAAPSVSPSTSTVKTVPFSTADYWW